MFGDPREAILSDIEDYTLNTLGPGMSGVSFGGPLVESALARFSSWEQDTLYLMLSHKDRVLFYGMDLKSPTPEDIMSMLGDADEAAGEVPASSRVTLFCRRKGGQSIFNLEEYLSSETDRGIEDLDHIEPRDEETNEDFFLRNAMWLLNPMVH